jgi:molybdenum cofactor sulfurtransferase
MVMDLDIASGRSSATDRFLAQFPAYGDTAVLDALRASDFARLDATKSVYLDFTGAGLHAASHVAEHTAQLTNNVFGNPHSASPSSSATTAAVERTRARVLEYFNGTGAYTCVFTLNASNALKLVGEAFPFAPGGRYLLTADNHNSVNGIREIARARGADVEYTRLNDELRLEGEERLLTPATAPSLFAFPAQSNFSGVQHPLGMIAPAQRAGYAVLLDAASYVPTNPLRLDVVHPEFVALSFYKMFGYPTGVGALIARRDALAALERPSFAGGTVEFVSVQHRTHLLKAGAEGFEDGTPNFGALAALRSGFELLGEAGMDNVKRHVGRLTTLLLAELAALHHPNGRAMARVYGPWDSTARGGTVAFNVFDRYGRVVPYQTVEREALASGVSVRGGCFCNPGAAERAFGFPAAESAACMERARHEGFSVEKFAECLGGGLAVGAVRASLGLASNGADVARLIDVVRQCC